eukprot:c731_g1_i1 orf=200-1618(+)
MATSMEIFPAEHGGEALSGVINVPTVAQQQQQQLLLPPSEKIAISVEVCLKPTSTARTEDVRLAVERMLEKRSLSYSDGPIVVLEEDGPYLLENVQSIHICDTDNQSSGLDGQTCSNKVFLFWQVILNVHVYQLNDEGPGEEMDNSENIASFHDWVLPSREFHGLWDSLIYDTGLKQRLLCYAESTLIFAEKSVDPHLISWNRVILLHGPPGTGKTSLCRALAQKLSIRFNSRFPQSQLVEVNAHSLFSKWFSESGKLVTRLFQKIQEFVEDGDILVFVLIDEVESLAAARQTALSGSEPSDSIRVVNALLTQLDRLKSWPNVVVLTTSNITGAIDLAFVDRADIKAYIGPPTVQARYEILRSCVNELCRVGILTEFLDERKQVKLANYATLQAWLTNSRTAGEECKFCIEVSKCLLAAAQASQGLSGRALRKLPFLAYASMPSKSSCNLVRFLSLLEDAAKRELSEHRMIM